MNRRRKPDGVAVECATCMVEAVHNPTDLLIVRSADGDYLSYICHICDTGRTRPLQPAERRLLTAEMRVMCQWVFASLTGDQLDNLKQFCRALYDPRTDIVSLAEGVEP